MEIQNKDFGICELISVQQLRTVLLEDTAARWFVNAHDSFSFVEINIPFRRIKWVADARPEIE
jgi:hypothetical protein